MIKDERGSLLVTVLFIGLILIVLSIALATLSLTEVRETLSSRDKTQAYYVAKSGVEATVKQLMNLSDSEKRSIQLPTSYTGNIGNHEYLVELTGSFKEITIKSTGKVNTREETVTHILKGKINSTTGVELDKDMAVFAGDKITLVGSTKVYGNVITNSTQSDSLSITGNEKGKIIGNLFIGPEGNINEFDHNSVEGDIRNLPRSKVYPFPTMPSFPELSTRTITGDKISQDGYYPEIHIKDETLTIDTGEGDRMIRTKKLYIDNGGVIKVTGKGKLSFYVEDEFKISQNHKTKLNADGHGSREVAIYYKGNKEVHVGGSIEATFYLGNADLEVVNNTNFKGNIISAGRKVIIHNNADSDVVLYAPNADIEISNHAIFRGAIVGKTVEAKHAEIRYSLNASNPIPILTEGNDRGRVEFQRSIWK